MLSLMKEKRKNYNTTLRTDLIRSLKILAAETDSRVNDLLEEAIEDLILKYRRSQFSFSTHAPEQEQPVRRWKKD
jgi:hypothetical protein